MSTLHRLWRATYRNEVLTLGVLLLLVPLLPHLSSSGPDSVPLEVWLLGLVPGSLLAMQALGVVLVYRANRFVNFAQIVLGTVGAAFFVYASQYLPLHRWAGSVCPPCVGDQPSDGFVDVNYWVTAALGLALAVLFSWLMYVLVVKRFSDRPRLTVTVASIFVAPALVAIVGVFTNTLTTVQQREAGPLATSSPLPWEWSWELGSATFTATDLITVAVAVVTITALAAYLRLSRTGLGIRAASDNPDRAELLGVNVHRIHSRVWVIVGLLSGICALLASMGSSPKPITSVSVDATLRVLLVAVVARFVSLPMAGIAALVVGVVETSAIWSFNGSEAPFDGALVVFVGVLLLLRAREGSSRADTLRSATLGGLREVRPVPPELKSLPTVQRWSRSLTALLAVVVLGLPWALSPGQTNLAALTFVYGILGLSLLVLTGWAGQISLGQFAFAAVGGFVVATWDAPVLVTLPVAACAGAVLALVVGVPALRLQGTYLMISTLALSVSVSTIVVSPRYLGRHLPATLDRPAVLGLSLEDQRTFYYGCLVVLVLAVLAVMGLRRSRIGRVLIAARENEQSAQSFGISVVRARLTGFAVSGFLAALAGAFIAYHQHGLPLAAFSETQSLEVFTMTVMGGLGSVAGPLLGAAYSGALLVFETSPVVRAFFLGFGGLALLLLFPGGLSQLAYGGRDAFLRRVAKRNRIVVPSLVADLKAEREDRRVPLAPTSRGGYVPRRYLLAGQWGLPAEPEGGAHHPARDASFAGLAQEPEPVP